MNDDSVELKFSKDLVAFVSKHYNVVYNSSPLQNCTVPDSATPFTRNISEAVKRILCLIHRQAQDKCASWKSENMEQEFKRYVSLKTFLVRNRKFELEEFLRYCTMVSLVATILYTRGCQFALGIIVTRIAFTLEYKRKTKEIDENIWGNMETNALFF